jgi:hypothetical protein
MPLESVFYAAAQSLSYELILNKRQGSSDTDVSGGAYQGTALAVPLKAVEDGFSRCGLGDYRAQILIGITM